MNLVDFFAGSLLDHESAVGLEFEGREYTFRELDARSNRTANLFSEDGLRAGDRLCVYLPNSVPFVEVYLAAVKLGLSFVPINVLYRSREIAWILKNVEPRATVTSGDLRDHLLTGLRGLKEPFLYLAEDLKTLTQSHSVELPTCPINEDGPAAIIYTSGTTGRSKGAVLTHGNFAANAENLIRSWKLSEADRLLLALPLFHVHGLGNGLHTWLKAGYRMRLLDRFRKETVAEEFLDFRPTVFFGVPTMYERLLDVEPSVAGRIGSFMRLFVSGSAPLPATTLERFRELYGHDILERYGMSETLMNISNPYAGERRPGSVGKPLPRVSIRLVDPESGNDVGGGEVGEVLIKGPNVFARYWQRPEATAAAFTEDGFFRSGDLAVRSADGYYTLVGRRSDLIVSGGFNIYPRQIEEFLQEQPEVAEAAVVGVPDRVRGEVPVAYLKPEPETQIDPERLASCCRECLASFKVPREFVVVEELPRNALGKLQRHLLPKQEVPE